MAVSMPDGVSKSLAVTPFGKDPDRDMATVIGRNCKSQLAPVATLREHVPLHCLEQFVLCEAVLESPCRYKVSRTKGTILVEVET